METRYIPGDSFAFKAFIDSHYETGTVKLTNINGVHRWVVTEDGVETIVRPEEARPEQDE